jgi:nucleoside-diphosphate-sugar epimerase
VPQQRRARKLTIAVTGPTGTFGHGLIPLLQKSARVGRIIGIARRPFEPAALGWTKMEYRRGDVRDQEALAEAFAGADAVAHLAFAIYGNASRETLEAINVDGTMNAFSAAADAGVRRFVYASSVAAYGFHPDNPIGITEDWPARGSNRMFYSREKAAIERRLHGAATDHPEVELTLFRPPIVVGPHTTGGAEEVVPRPLRPIAHGIAGLIGKLPVSLPAVPVPQPVQFVHEADVGQAFVKALLGGPPGTYNLSGDGHLTGTEVMRELGFRPLPFPDRATRAAASALIRLPRRPAAFDWAEAATHPLIVDSTKAKRELGWKPKYSSLEALRDAVQSNSG